MHQCQVRQGHQTYHCVEAARRVFASKSVPLSHHNPLEADQHHAYAEYIRFLHSQLRRVIYLPDLISAVVHIKVGLWGEAPAPLTFPVLLDADQDPPYPYECPVFAKVGQGCTARHHRVLSSTTSPRLLKHPSAVNDWFTSMTRAQLPMHSPVPVPLTNLTSMCRLCFVDSFRWSAFENPSSCLSAYFGCGGRALCTAGGARRFVPFQCSRQIDGAHVQVALSRGGHGRTSMTDSSDELDRLIAHTQHRGDM